MTIREYFRCLSRSALGMGTLFASIVVGLSAYAAGFGLVASMASFIGAGAVLTVLGFLSGFGPRAAAAEEERQAGLKAARRLSAAGTSLERLASLRLEAPGPAQARDLVVLEGQRYLEACAAVKGRASMGPAYDPGALESIDEALGIVDAWLKEADETSLEKRFGAEDAHPFADAENRVVAALKDKAASLARGRDLVSGEIAAPDRIAIEEELR
jgi:hypothetical protein